MASVLSYFVSFVALVAPAAAVPVPSSTDAASEDHAYPADTSPHRKGILYGIPTAVGLVVIGCTIFGAMKYSRGERVCPGVQRKSKEPKPQDSTTWPGAREMDSIRRNTPGRSIRSMYGAENPYRWPAEQVDSPPTANTRPGVNLYKPLPRRPRDGSRMGRVHVSQPNLVEQPPQVIPRKAVPGRTHIRTISQNESGFFVILRDSDVSGNAYSRPRQPLKRP